MRLNYFWGDSQVLKESPRSFVTYVSEVQSHLEVIFYDREAARKVIDIELPEYAGLFGELTFDTVFSDVFRLAILYAQGGWYLDYGVVPTIDLSRVSEKSVIFQRTERYPGRICNGFMYFNRPGHPYLKFCLDMIASNAEFGRHLYNVPKFCGTRVTSAARDKGLADDCNILSYDEFKEQGLIKSEKRKWLSGVKTHNWTFLQAFGLVRGLPFNDSAVKDVVAFDVKKIDALAEQVSKATNFSHDEVVNKIQYFLNRR